MRSDIVLYRRKREGRTNYKKRLVYLKSDKPRLVVRKTNKQLILQLVSYNPQGDKIITGVDSLALKKLGWNYSCNNLPACYLAGVLIAQKAKRSKTAEAILDSGLHTHVLGSRIYAAIKGAVDGGLSIPVDEETFPDDKRLNGEHIASYYKHNKDPKQFSSYKKGADPSKMAEAVAAVKKKIMNG